MTLLNLSDSAKIDLISSTSGDPETQWLRLFYNNSLQFFLRIDLKILFSRKPQNVEVEEKPVPAQAENVTRLSVVDLSNTNSKFNSVQSLANSEAQIIPMGKEMENDKVSQLFSFLQILTAIFGSFAHGGNDVR